MNIIITGTNGFLGGHIYEILSQYHNTKKIRIRNDNLYCDEILNFNPDIFIHCGWGSGNNFSEVDSYEQFDNVITGFNLLKCLQKIKKLYFIGLGSFSEYGINFNLSSEKTRENPNDYYGVFKNSFKNISRVFCNKNNFDWLWLRPCYIYGPNDVNTRLIPNVINKCLNGGKLHLNSCNSMVDYLFIEDFIEALHLLIKGNNVGVFNICSGKQYKVKDVVLLINEITNNNADIIFDKSKDRENTYTDFVCGYNNKLLDTINWSPKFNLKKGLTKTINLKGSKLNEKK